jgi:hypothetical protein
LADNFKQAMKKIWCFLILSIGLIITNPLKAQEYKTAIGLRAGSSSGLTVKHFLNQKSAIEGLLTSRWRGFQLTGLYELNGNAFEVPHLGWYFGGGAHLGFYDYYDKHPWMDDRYNDGAIFGLDMILGLEYTFEEIPLNLALDWKPEFNFVGYNGVWGDVLALSIRFAIR